MTESQNDNSLLETIRKLIRQLFSIITLSRLRSYRPQAKNATGKDLSAQLHEFLKHPATPSTEATGPGETSSHRDEGIPENESQQTSVKAVPKPAETTTIKKEHLGARVPSDSVGSKLMQSAWEHLHASVRYARLGNADTAKLHASIMESSLKEAAHFLEEDVYTEFVQNLSRELQGLTRH